MPAKNNSAGARRHIVLIPGFGGFDALGQVEYYAGVTQLFQHWKHTSHPQPPVALHYFDNLPTAAVATRAHRLCVYLAKRMARGEILDTDKIVLVGHSTGGLDIRRLISDLHNAKNRKVHADGESAVPASAILNCIDRVVFLSVPHWGTNIADWAHSHSVLRKTAVTDLRAVIAGSQLCLLDKIESGIAAESASLTGADLILALRDALTEANGRLAGSDPTRIAAAEEAASELELYFRQMATDFRAIDDLTSQPNGDKVSPAHFDNRARIAELSLWKRLKIQTLSYPTVGGRPFLFPTDAGCPAPTLDLRDPFAYADIATGSGLSAGTDFSYRLCYRACAGGPFRRPKLAGEIARILEPAPPEPLELWDNDGIVNTLSMLWPGENTLVLADHLDIVGHYRLRRAPHNSSLRTYRSYDSLKSVPLFTDKVFKEIWTEIFLFSI